MRRTSPRWLGFGLLGTCLALFLASPVAAFSVFTAGVADPQQALTNAARWAAGSGLSDGIQVGVEAGFATDLGAANAGEVALIAQAVIDAITGWENEALTFDITFDAAGVVEGPTAGFEIDLFAVPGTHPMFAGTDFFGVANPFVAFDPGRTLTNGQALPGDVITGADVYINTTNTAQLAALLGFTLQQKIDSLVRLIMHEFGHALGLGHPNSNNPFGVENNYDTDLDPLNPMPIDPNDPFASLILSTNPDNAAVMSNRPCGEPFVGPCAALFFTSPTNDDLGGRDALYPVVPEPGVASLLAAGAVALAALRRRRLRGGGRRAHGGHLLGRGRGPSYFAGTNRTIRPPEACSSSR